MARFRQRDADTPVLLMGYLNPVEIHGYERFAAEAVTAGVDGVLLVDCPLEESAVLAPLREATSRPGLPGLRVGLNYGLDRVRFISPVRSGSRVRATFTVAAITEEAPGKFREEMDVVLEVEGGERPALAARWLTMYLL